MGAEEFEYQWDEVGRLAEAARWDLPPGTTPPADGVPSGAVLGAKLRHAYDAGDQRVLKTAIDSNGNDRHTVYVFESLELRRAAYGFAGTAADADYELSKTTEVPCLFAHGVRLARVAWEDLDVPSIGQTHLHVLFELGDHLGSTSVVLDKATSELVERSTFQAYGAAESDYRPGRWAGFREDYRFTGKEDDVEVGLQYFGKRYYAPLLGRWVSADPLSLHGLGADLNLYAYVSGKALKAIDPLGLEETANSSFEAFVQYSDASVGSGQTSAAGEQARTNASHAPAAPVPARADVRTPTMGTGGTAPDIKLSQQWLEHLRAASEAMVFAHDYDIPVDHPVMDGAAETTQAYGGVQGAGGSTWLPEVPRYTLRVGTIRHNLELAAAPDQRSLLGAAARESGVVANGIRGRASEARVLGDLGLPKNKATVFTGEGRSIPDALTRALSVEIKDAAEVSLTRQLRIQTEAARASGRESVLVTGENTCVSSACSRAFDTVIRRPDLGPR